jgi:hypothetical protein
MVEVSEHYRPTGDAYEAGVYRVVGTPSDVTLLRVTTADGRRVHTGEIHHVSPCTLDTEFEATDDPDTGFSPISSMWNVLSGSYWELRRFF